MVHTGTVQADAKSASQVQRRKVQEMTQSLNPLGRRRVQSPGTTQSPIPDLSDAESNSLKKKNEDGGGSPESWTLGDETGGRYLIGHEEVVCAYICIIIFVPYQQIQPV